MSYKTGNRMTDASAKLAFLMKNGMVTDRALIDASYPNAFLETADDDDQTTQLPVLVRSDENNQTNLANPNGILAYALKVVQISTPATPTAVVNGTAGSTSYTYKVAAWNGLGTTLGHTPSSTGVTKTTGNATLTSTNSITITWAPVTGASFYRVYRSASSGTPSSTGQIGDDVPATFEQDGTQTTSYSLTDTGLAGDSVTPPTTNTTGGTSVTALAVGTDFAVINDVNGNAEITLTAAVTPVNALTVTNAATGSGPSIAATGSDTNIVLTVKGKGTGALILGQATATGVELAADQPILDSSANEFIKFTKTASAVNEVTVANASTGNGPTLLATGETNVPITLGGKGTGAVILGQATSVGVELAADQPILDSSANELIKFTKVSSAVNELTVSNNSTGVGPVLSATGETNVPITLKGKGTGPVNLGQATSTGVVLLADQPINDSSGNPFISFSKTSSAVNGIGVTNAATGNGTTNPVVVAPIGSDSAIGLTIAPKAASGALTLGLSTGTADILVGSSSGTQTVKIGNGAGVATVNLANVSVAGANVNIAGAVTGAGVTDTVSISGGNAAATGVKTVNVLTGAAGTSGNNRFTVGGGATSVATVNAVARTYQDWNYISSTTGSANALSATLNDSGGSAVTVAAGLKITVKLSAGLQAGANTFNLNSHGTDSVKKSTAPSVDLGTAYVTGSIVTMVFDGTAWQVIGQ